jgi:lathosterol oxidase
LFNKEEKKSKAEWERQSKEMERLVIEVEGKDERSYLPEESKKQQ